MKKLLHFTMLSILLLVGSLSFAQNGIIGSGFTNGFGVGDILGFNASAGTSRELTLQPRGTGNQFFRLVRNWSGDLTQFGPFNCVDTDWTTPELVYGMSVCNTSGAFFINCPNTTDNYVFKTPNSVSTVDFLHFRVQGAVRSVSSVSQLPAAGAVLNNQAVAVTANLNGALSAGQAVYIRYTTNGFSTSTVAQMTGSGTTYTSTIPANAGGANVAYYVFTSGTTNVAANGSNADLYTINFNNNGGVNYGYAVSANPISIESTTGVGAAGATYATLKAAVDAINAGTYTGVVTVRIGGNTLETVPSVLNASGAGAASYTSINVQPTGGAARTISGAIAAGFMLLDLNGADNVTIDGLNTGGNSLTFSNTTVSTTANTSTIRFQTDATNNTITNCSILGSSNSSAVTTGGNIWFGANSTLTGNDNNTISNCIIGPAGANLPSKGIYFSGTTTTLALNNSGNIITNNNFVDVFGAAVESAGVYSTTGSTANTFTNNKFYQTATRTWTTGALHTAIKITNTTTGTGAYTVTGNIIGYANSASTGTYTLTGSTGKFNGISLNSVTGGVVSDISNNTIANVSLTGVTSSGTSTNSPFIGIIIANGLASTNSNTIGSQSATGSLVFSTNSSTATDVYGLYNVGFDVWTSNTNSIGGISVTNAAASGTQILYGMRANTATGVSWTATNNTVGGSVANSIQLTATGVSSQVIGMYSSNAPMAFASNTIRNLSSNIGTGTTTSASVIGICHTSTTPNNTISQSTIYNLNNTNTSTATTVTGIQFTGASANIVNRNNIYNLTSASTIAGAEVNGIKISGGTTIYSNNMIALGNGLTTSPLISGINEFLGTNSIWNNSIFIGGAPTSGTGNSFAFNGSQTSNTRSFRNNIFVNTRNNTGATAKHYIVKVGGTGVNPSGLTINNNVYFGNGTGNVFGQYGSPLVDRLDLAAWQSAIGQDAGSIYANPIFVDPTNASSPDLHINPAVTTPVEATGFDLGIIVDVDGQVRSGLTPVDIGADAGNFTPLTLCAVPSDQPTSLVAGLVTSTSAAASFTAATSAPSGYLVVTTNGTSFVGSPVDGTVYALGAPLGNGLVVQSSNSLAITQPLLPSNTNGVLTIFSYNSGACSGGPKYQTTSPLSGTITTCAAAPTAPITSAVTTTGATVSWTASVIGGGLPTPLPAGTISYVLEVYSDAGFTLPIVGSPFSSGVTTNVALSGLSVATNYFYRLKANNTFCDSAYINGNFTTACIATPIATSQGFNAPTIPACWSVSNVLVQTGTKISFVTSGSNPTTVPQEGSNMLLYGSFVSANGGAGSEERIASLPISSIGTSSVDVDFYLKNENNTTYSTGAYLNEGVQLQYSIDGTTWVNAGGFFARHDGSLASGTSQWKLKTVTIPSALANLPSFYVALKFRSEFGDNIFVDNFTVKGTPDPIVITPLPSAAICIGDSTSLSASSAASYTYTWSPALGLSATTGATVTANPTVTTVYTVTGSNSVTSTSNTITVTVNPAPSAVTITPNATVCQDVINTLTASSTTLASANIGVSTTGSAAANTPYRQSVTTNARMQYLITKAELNAAGINAAGNITSLAFTTTSAGSGTIASYAISMGNTPATGMTSSFLTPSLTNVYTAVNYVVTLGSNLHTFTTPFTWDGLSNVVINICHSGPGGTSAVASMSSPAATSTVTSSGSTSCTVNTGGTTSINRPIMNFGFVAQAPITWSPITDLYTDAGATIAYTGTAASTVYNKAISTTTYTATATLGTCTKTATSTITVNTPVLPTFFNPSPICAGGVVALPIISTNGITGTWSPAPNNLVTTLYSFTPDAGQCATSGAFITQVVNQNASSTFASIAPVCIGDAITLPATSLEGNAGTWSPAINNTATTTYTFTPNVGICASPGTLTVSVGTSTTWTAGTPNFWSNGAPTSTSSAVIATNYSEAADISACTLIVTGNSTVTIPSNFDVTLQGALTVGVGSTFNLSNNANLVQSRNELNTGNITVTRQTGLLKRLDYNLWSSPVVGQNLLQFSPNTIANRFYTYSPTTNVYEAIVPSTNSFQVGTGYLIRVSNFHPATVATSVPRNFTGVPTNGLVSLSVANNTYNAIGNPYPSTISADDFITANSLVEPLYFWRKSNTLAPSTSYATYTLAGGVGTSANSFDTNATVPNGFIQVGQGFLVKSTSTALNFTNAMRLGNNAGQFFRSNESRSRIWLNLTNSNDLFSQTMIAYMPNATVGFDAAIDGRILNETATATTLTTIINNEEYAVQGRPTFDVNDSVALGFKSETAGNFTIAINNVDGLFTNGQNVYLKDALTNTVHNLTASAYVFATQAGEFNSRFSIIYQETLATNVNTSDANSIVIYKQNKNVVINSGKTAMKSVKIFDLQGRLLVEKDNVNATELALNVTDAQQVLLVKVVTVENVIVSKKVLN